MIAGLRWQPPILFRFPLSPQSADWGRSCAGAIITNFYQINIAAQISSKFRVKVQPQVLQIVAKGTGRAEEVSILSVFGLNCGQELCKELRITNPSRLPAQPTAILKTRQWRRWKNRFHFRSRGTLGFGWLWVEKYERTHDPPPAVRHGRS